MIYPEDYIDKIICGNSMDIMKDIPNNSVDLLLTDPPYGILNDVLWDIKPDELETFTKQWYSIVLRIIKSTGSMYIFWSQKYLHLGLEIFNPDRILIWHHPNMSQVTSKAYTWNYDPILYKKGEYFDARFSNNENKDVMTFAMPQSNFKEDKRQHIAQKPIKLVRSLIKVSSPPESIVCDPFLGSGTAALAAEQLNRRWIGIDISEEYCKIAQKGIDDYRKQLRFKEIKEEK